MSTASTAHHHILGPTSGAVLASVIIIGGAAAIGIALPTHDSTRPVAPTSECTIESCGAGSHPVLPGRHDFGIRPGGQFHATTSGGQPQLGQP